MKLKTTFKRANAFIVAAVLVVATIVPFIAITGGVASAGELEPREITMYNSSPGASTTYVVQFTTATTGNLNGIVVDFCANDPIPGDSCTTGSGSLNGFSLGSTPSVAETGLNSGTWTATSNSSSPYTTLFYTSNCASSCSTNSGTAIKLTISNVTNPTPSAWPSTFYARIFTFSTSAAATSYTSTVPGSYTDAGGDALAITQQSIDVTAKVFETLTFCVWKTSCGTAPAANLGASTTDALSSSYTYGSSAVGYTLATNDQNGVTVTMTGTTLCSAATLSYANCEGAGTPPTIAAMTANGAAVTGTSQFGMCVNTANFTNVTAANEYKDGGSGHCPSLTEGTQYTPGTSPLVSGTTFGFNDVNSSGGTNNSAGSTIMSSTGPVSSNTGYLDFIANITNTTPSGVYQSNLNLVATADF